LTFLVNALFVGALYGFLWSLFVAVRKWPLFISTLKEFSAKKDILRLRIIVITTQAIANPQATLKNGSENT